MASSSLLDSKYYDKLSVHKLQANKLFNNRSWSSDQQAFIISILFHINDDFCIIDNV